MPGPPGAMMPTPAPLASEMSPEVTGPQPQLAALGQPAPSGSAALSVVIQDGPAAPPQAAASDSQMCHCCSERRTPGHRWCANHKRVYDAMVRDITRKKKRIQKSSSGR